MITAYIVLAAFFFSLQWYCLFWAMKNNHAGWQQLADRVETTELLEQRPQWPIVFAELVVNTIIDAILWPRLLAKITVRLLEEAKR